MPHCNLPYLFALMKESGGREGFELNTCTFFNCIRKLDGRIEVKSFVCIIAGPAASEEGVEGGMFEEIGVVLRHSCVLLLLLHLACCVRLLRLRSFQPLRAVGPICSLISPSPSFPFFSMHS
jgi:hypothetical protein